MSQHSETLARLHLRPSFNSTISIAACFGEKQPSRKVSAEQRRKAQARRSIEAHQERIALAHSLGCSLRELGEVAL